MSEDLPNIMGEALSQGPSATVKSARRVLEILELFDEVRHPLSLTEIARRLAYPVPSALALLKSLQEMEYVTCDPVTKVYAPTLRVCMLGNWLHGKIFQEGAVITMMSELRQQTEETVMLAMQNDIHAQYVHTLQSQKPLRYFLRPGSLRPIHRSATGRMLLAQMSDDDVRTMARLVNARVEPAQRIVDENAFLQEISQIREQGYAYNDQYTDGAAAVAVALPVPPDMSAAVLAVGGPAPRIQARLGQLTELMRSLIARHIELS